MCLILCLSLCCGPYSFHLLSLTDSGVQDIKAHMANGFEFEFKLQYGICPVEGRNTFQIKCRAVEAGVLLPRLVFLFPEERWMFLYSFTKNWQDLFSS